MEHFRSLAVLCLLLHHGSAKKVDGNDTIVQESFERADSPKGNISV